MIPLAEPDDVAAIWHTLTDAQVALAQALISQASTKLRLLGRKNNIDIDALILADPLMASLVKDMIANAVKRVLMNPDAVRQMSRTTGPWSESKTIDTAISSGLLYLDPAELVNIIPPKSPFRSFRVRGGLA